MSQRDGFTGGFLAGAIVGGVVGGIIGTLLAAKVEAETEASETSLLNSNSSEPKAANLRKKRQLKDSETIEVARQSLEDKIAQLNLAIDEVRLSLGNVNGNVIETEREYPSET